MDTTESLGYLKGLLDGMDLDESKKETKIYRAMIGVLENLAEDVNDLTDGVEMMADQLDAVDEDLGDVEEYLYGDEDDDDCDCGCCDDDEDECQEFEIECPACHETFVVDECWTVLWSAPPAARPWSLRSAVRTTKTRTRTPIRTDLSRKNGPEAVLPPWVLVFWYHFVKISPAAWQGICFIRVHAR